MYIYLYIYTNKRNKRIWDIHVLGRDCPCSSAFWWFCRFYVSTLLLGIRASTGSMRILFGGLYKGTFKLFRIRTWLLSYCNYFKVCFPKIHMLKHNDQCYVIRRWGFGKVLGCWVGAPINHISALVKAPSPSPTRWGYREKLSIRNQFLTRNHICLNFDLGLLRLQK